MTDELNVITTDSLLSHIANGHSTVSSIQSALSLKAAQISSIKNKINYALKQGYLVRYGSKPNYHYQLSEKGEKHLAAKRISRIQPSYEKREGWWLILFDIPESQRQLRDKFRHLFKQAGIRQLQRSVWVSPVDIRSEIATISQLYGIDNSTVICLEIKGHPDLEALFQQ